jgi:hypothetical protein
MTDQLFYAGIGARVTPAHMLNIMSHVAKHLFTEGWTLRTGAGGGADTVFEQAVDQIAYEQGVNARKEIYLPWKGFNNSTSYLHPGHIPFSDQETAFTARFHPAWDRCTPAAQRLHTRNTRIMLGHPSLHGEKVRPVRFVVCWTEGGKVQGGTGQALRIAQALNIPVFNLGSATNTAELEAMIHEIERLQQAIKRARNDG